MNLNKEFVVITPQEVFENVPKPVTEEENPPVSEQDMLQSVLAKAECVIEEAKNEAADIRKQAWQEGYDEGKQHAKKELEEMIRSQAEDARRIFKKLDAYKRDLYQDLLDNVIGLSFDIAKKIINIHLKKDDKLYVEIARSAIQALNASSKFTLRVSRSEYDRFFGEGGQWRENDIGGIPFKVVCDPYMAEGGCIADSDEGIVNAGVDEQLDKLRRILESGTEPNEVL
jgi:flagellar assembly protein FliH